MKADLTLLYSELGLKPNCSLEELQLAYRRRISELHPRRPGAKLPSQESAYLCDLIGLYTTATRFHRRYGRLPGEAPRRIGGAGPSQAGASRAYAAYSPRPYESRPFESRPSSDPSPPAPSRAALVLAVAVLILLFGLLALASGEWLR
ncbi:MAG: J domain-containing protein [Lysobacter sp.]|nr:J domain-containing protein [Lysobacter sp.]